MIRSKVKYKKISNDDGYIDAQVSKFSLVWTRVLFDRRESVVVNSFFRLNQNFLCLQWILMSRKRRKFWVSRFTTGWA